MKSEPMTMRLIRFAIGMSVVAVSVIGCAFSANAAHRAGSSHQPL